MISSSKRKQDNYFDNIYLIANGLLVFLIILHFYIFGYNFWFDVGMTHPDLEPYVARVARTPIFDNYWLTKLAILFLACLSFSLMKIYKSVEIHLNSAIRTLILGVFIFFCSTFIMEFNYDLNVLFISYVIITIVGFILLNIGLGKVFRYFKSDLKKDIFNKEQESFPQETRLIENENSVNLKAKYYYKKKERNSYINFIDLYRGLLIAGSPGSGKTYFIIRHIIKQLIEKDFTMLVYDFKYPGLSTLTYNILREHYPNSNLNPAFYCINFDDLSRSHRVNPLAPEQINDISDAYQSASSLYNGMKTSKGDTKEDPFWNDGAINILTAIIWILKKEDGGKYCTFPHLIEFMMGDHRKYLPILMTDVQASKYANVAYNALVDQNTKLLNNLMSTAKQRLAKIASPNVYWVTTGSDFTLDLNNPEEPKVLCLANNDQKNHVYSAPISLIVNKISKEINKKDKLKCATIFDEFPTIYFENVSKQIATARENKVATILSVQDASQNEKNLGKVNSDIIFNITPNIISGALSGDMAKKLSERLGKIKMVRDSINLGKEGPTTSQSVQMGEAVPVSTINSLTSGEVVGVVADTPFQNIEFKRFHSKIQNNHEELKKFDDRMESLPVIYKGINQDVVNENFKTINVEANQLISKLYLKYSNNSNYTHIFSILEETSSI